jgi:hypothetical protein
VRFSEPLHFEKRQRGKEIRCIFTEFRREIIDMNRVDGESYNKRAVFSGNMVWYHNG